MNIPTLRWIILTTLVLSLLAAAPLRAQDKATPLDEFRAIQKETVAAMQDFSKSYRDAKTEEERKKLLADRTARLQSGATRLLALATQHPQESFAAEALASAVMNDFMGETGAKALAALARDHADSQHIAGLIPSLQYSTAPAAAELLQSVLEKSPRRELQAQACLGLAKLEQNRSAEKSEKYFAQLAEKFGDVKQPRGNGTMADLARQELKNMKTFGIGKVAPDIEGEDIDGKKFKLSDYRGKVVVIDFWGDW